MAWLKDAAWRQGIAILFVVAGAALTYRGAAGSNALDPTALFGFALFCTGIALPLISQIFVAHHESTGKSEDV